MSTIEFAGKSGSRYRYTTLEEDRFLPPAGANFVIAQLASDGATVVMAGETDNLSARVWRDRLEEARSRFGEVHVLTRLNVRSAVRREELEDMISGHQPPMNETGRPAGGSASEGDRAAS
ncbi:MAG: hypothetical protein Q8M88_13875 [Phenylobacterium sp.]|uniref:hypothetical protein n=1 Tax=Phenylobacterium sp. TaxID=1871053 RepID=UPI002734EC5F|nr:hypothetical protein [Phenylobacterium sp.]MDP3175516.1 hypothetical protein [Phenylobacterium sp.]